MRTRLHRVRQRGDVRVVRLRRVDRLRGEDDVRGRARHEAREVGPVAADERRGRRRRRRRIRRIIQLCEVGADVRNRQRRQHLRVVVREDDALCAARRGRDRGEAHARAAEKRERERRRRGRGRGRGRVVFLLLLRERHDKSHEVDCALPQLEPALVLPLDDVRVRDVLARATELQRRRRSAARALDERRALAVASELDAHVLSDPSGRGVRHVGRVHDDAADDVRGGGARGGGGGGVVVRVFAAAVAAEVELEARALPALPRRPHH
eukprot:31379-Pelagococcus_subviridis.AAC.6